MKVSFTIFCSLLPQVFPLFLLAILPPFLWRHHSLTRVQLFPPVLMSPSQQQWSLPPGHQQWQQVLHAGSLQKTQVSARVSAPCPLLPRPVCVRRKSVFLPSGFPVSVQRGWWHLLLPAGHGGRGGAMPAALQWSVSQACCCFPTLSRGELARPVPAHVRYRLLALQLFSSGALEELLSVSQWSSHKLSMHLARSCRIVQTLHLHSFLLLVPLWKSL